MPFKLPTVQTLFELFTRPAPNVTTFRNGAYNTGISEQDIENKAIEDGHTGILDPATVGVNSHPHAIDGLVEGHAAASGVISYDTRDELQAVDATLEKELLNFDSTKAAALDANSNYESAERERILQWRRMKVTGLPIPSKKAGVILAAAMIGLFVGDWGLITLGYQVLGLSDHPWIPGIAFTDDLHLAAFSSVFAIVVLGEVVGERLRRIEYALENRRRAVEAERDKLPKPAAFDVFWLTVCLLGALAGLAALSYIRSEYLKALGVGDGGPAFFGIQLAILLAAIALGFAHANPEAKRWMSIDKKAGAAEVKRTTAADAHAASGSRINAAIDERQAILAKAGHHIGTNAANVVVQTSDYKRRYSLSQLEPVQERLFGEHKAPKQDTDEGLLAKIVGIRPIASFEKVTTTSVMGALEKTRSRLGTLRARIDQVEINKLNLPQLDEDSGLTEDPAVVTTAETPEATPLRTLWKTVPVDENFENDDTDEETA
ncbi:hypothetical protein [Arthrobacter sp. 31Y]|uniref:hypothetical protein n=1 Tax=Arthrobacter sp. 31Y TaxID=1115632 RepID=UPI0004654DBB|nr:hypothetical protein [Arthrobacter sp. 31Y]